MSTYAMNTCLKELGGVAATDYSAGTVAWNDGQRGSVNGSLSAFGSNITDARIRTRKGTHLNVARPNNMNEKLGVTNASNFLFVEKDGTQVTAQEVLETISERAKYMGYTSVNPRVSKNQKVVYRVQNAWIPFERGQTEEDIVPEHYSYQTTSRSNPRNLIVLGTSQGVFVHSDGVGEQKLFAHETAHDGNVSEHWFKAEATSTRVGHSVLNDTVKAGDTRAHAVELGVKGMGPRANCFVVMSIPNEQKMTIRSDPTLCDTLDDYGDDGTGLSMPVYRSLNAVGVSRSARVSVSNNVAGTAMQNRIAIQRPEAEPIVCTILLYNTMQVPKGTPPGVPCNVSKTDLALAVSDMEHIYDLANEQGGSVCKLSELPAMLHKLTRDDMALIYEKITTPFDPMVPTKNAL